MPAKKQATTGEPEDTTATDDSPHVHDYKAIVDKDGNQVIGFHTHACRCGARVRRS